MACAQFAQPGAAFARGPASVPAVAYGDERPVRLTGDEPFDTADDLEPALALAGLPGGVVPGGLVVSQADDGDVRRNATSPCRLPPLLNLCLLDWQRCVGQVLRGRVPVR